MTRTHKWPLWLALAVLLLAVGLRFYRLDAQSLWNDEGTTVALVQRSLGTIARNASDDIHPPLYYFVLAGWVRLWGTAEFAIRSLSALMGVATVALTMLLARRWFGWRTALLAGLLAAVSPFGVYYAQEARMYMQVTLLGAASVLSLSYVLPVEAERQPLRLWPLVAYGLITLAMLYSHYYAASLLLAENLAFVVWLALRRDRRPIWRDVGRWALVQTLLLIAYALWIAFAWHTIRYWPSISAPFTLGQLVLRLAQALPLGITVHTTAWTLTAGVGLAALAAVGLLRRPQRTASSRTGWWPLVLCGLYAAVPVGLMYAASLRRPMYNPKFLLLCTPGYLLLLARGIVNAAEAIGRRVGQVAGTSALVLLTALPLTPMLISLHNLYTDETFFRDDYRGIVAYIEAVAGPDDAVLVNAPSQVETVDYYYDGDWPVYPLPQSRPADRAVTEGELAEILATHERVYGIFWATDESDPDGIVSGYLDSHAFKTMDAWHGDVRLVVYAAAKEAPEEPAVTTDYCLGEVVLDGYALLTPEPAAGDAVQVTLFWHTEQALTERFKVFVHLVDAGGHIVGQHDAEPGGGSRPTDGWAVGQTVRDNHGILIQPGTPPGTLILRVGLYDSETGARLPVTVNGDALGDAIDLAELPLTLPDTPLPIEAFDAETRIDESVAGAEVLGYSLYPLGLRHEARRTLYSGEAVELVLYARGGGAAVPAQVSLERRGRTLVELDLADLTGGLPAGHIARTVSQFSLPAEVAAGRYRLVIRSAGDEAATLGTVRVTTP